jgi:VCBS repeat-containing protein
MFKKNTSLFIPLLFACSTSLFAARFGAIPEAVNDNGHLIIGVTSEYSGNVLGNDKNTTGASVDFKETVGKFGRLSSVDSEGEYTYTVYDSVNNSSLAPGETVEEIFRYDLTNNSRGSSAVLVITLSTVDLPKPAITSNVDIEFNDRSAQATPLNSGKNILGHLHNSGDKDWYSLPSAGNEIITLEVCPQTSSCFGKKSWVLYVFDSDRLTSQMEQ